MTLYYTGVNTLLCGLTHVFLLTDLFYIEFSAFYDTHYFNVVILVQLQWQ